MAQQPPRQIVEIVRPLAQDGIAQALHAQARFVLHAFDRGFGGQAGAHGVAHALAPALVVGEQAIGLDHLAPLAGQIEFAGGQHLVHGFAQASRWPLPAASVRRPDCRRSCARPCTRGSCSTTRPTATPSDRPSPHEFARPVDAQFRLVQFGDVEEAALRHHLGQHHGDGLQRLDFFFGIDALGLVLHRQHAEHLAAAHDGHAQEGLERVFAGFRPVGEMRIGGRVATG